MNNSKPKILIIAPTALDWNGQPIKERRLHLPCLTLPHLAAVTPDSVDVTLIYETVESIPYDKKWDLVALTGMGSGIVRAWQIADEFKKKDTKVVIGGISATISNPEWSLKHCDTVVIGEADDIWKEVIEDFLSGKLKSIYEAKTVPDITKLPVPRYELMNKRKIGLWLPVQTTRGCPHTCSFCSVTAFYHNSFRTRPIESVIRDVKAAKQIGTRYIAFIDDNMIGDLNYCAELWEALIPHKIIWMTQSSLLLANYPDLLKLAHKSGCRLVSIGIESTNPDSLKTIGKGWNNPKRYKQAIDSFRSHNIEVSTEMIIGFDCDDITAVSNTYNFIKENRISVPRVHILTPIPGTEMFKKLENDNRIINNDFRAYTGSKSVFKPLHIDPEELEKKYWEMYGKIYSWKSIFNRLLPSETSLGPYMRAVVWASNLKYRKHVKKRISPGIL